MAAATIRNPRKLRRSPVEALAERRAELAAVVAAGRRGHASNALALELLREATRAELAAWIAAEKRRRRRPANDDRDLFSPAA